MTFPLQITFRNMDKSEALEARIREKAAALTRFEGDIQRCQVVVEAPHRHHHKGKLYTARIEVIVPRGNVVVTRDNQLHHAHEDPYVVVRDAFDAAVRQLEDHVRRLGGQVKRHEEPLLHGRVARFVAEEGYGFIETDEGQEVYFHRNSVTGNGFDRLRVGDAVRLVAGEGDKGPQASTVHVVGRQRATG